MRIGQRIIFGAAMVLTTLTAARYMTAQAGTTSAPVIGGLAAPAPSADYYTP